MAQTFPRIEDIVDILTADLDTRGFSRIAPKINEVLRYEKRDSSIQFQVGIDNYANDQEEPEFNHFYLSLGYAIPPYMTEIEGERLFPNSELLYIFFQNSVIYHQGFCGTKDHLQDGRMKLIYHIGFEKNKATAPEMRAVLREFIDYTCNYVSLNTEMVGRTSTFS